MDGRSRKSDLKAPRTVITETQSVKPVRNRDRLVRTPDDDRHPQEHVSRSLGQITRSPARSQPPAEGGRSPSFYAVQKNRKSSMANFKTPKTLITEYLDSQKTLTAQPPRHRDALVRTPDVYVKSPEQPVRSPARVGRSPGRFVQHERVSSLRGKRTRSLTSLTDDNTPRGLIEGFLAGEDTTAPVVRRLRRTSQSTYSASQPVMSLTKRQTPAQTSMLGQDTDTPRALIQNFLRNATNVIETPVVSRDDPSSDVSPTTPVIPESQEYHTPSPFKSSSQSTDTSKVTRSAKRSEPRKPAASYHIHVPIVGQEDRSSGWEGLSPSDIIQPSSPGSNVSYQVPSAFLSSPESTTDMPVSQSQAARKHTLGWARRATLNLSFPGQIVRDTYQVSPRSGQVQPGEDNSYTDEEEEIIPETHLGRETTLQEQHVIYNLPMKDSSREDADDHYDVNDGRDLEKSRSRRSAGRNRNSSIEVTRRANDFDHSRKISTDSHVDKLSMDRSRRSSVLADTTDDFDGEKENVDFDRMSNVSQGSLHDSSRSSIISYRGEVTVDRQRIREEIDRRTLSDEEVVRKRKRDSGGNVADMADLDVSFDAMYERHMAREGRSSEGHLLKERKPLDARPGRYSDSHLVTGQGHLVQGKGERSFGDLDCHKSLENSPVRSVSKRRSNISANNSSDNSLDLTSSTRSGTPRDFDFEEETHLMSQSQQRNYSVRKVDGYMREDSSSKSRSKRQRVSSRKSFEGQGHADEGRDIDVDNEGRISPSDPAHIHTLPDNTASFSPAVASTQRINFLLRHSPSHRTSDAFRQGQAVNDNISQFSPRISSTQKAQSFNDGSTTVLARKQQGLVESLPDNTANFSPKIASTQRLHTNVGNTIDDSPLDHASPSPVVSPQEEGLSHTGTPGSGSRRAQRNSPSGNMEPSSPLDTVTPSPVVSPQRDSISLSRTPRSSARRTRTPPSTSVTKTSKSSTRKTSSAGSHRSVSLRSSKLKTSSGGWRTVSSGSSGRGRPSTGSESSQSRLNESISRFSPRISSTRSGHCVSEAVAADVEGKQPSETQFVSNNTVNITGTEAVSASTQREEATVETGIQAKKKRSPRRRPQYCIPVSMVKKDFTRYAGMRVSKEAIEKVMKISEVYWDNLASDLEAFAKHAGRKKITMDDFVLLFKRQGLINEKQCMNSLIEKYLPMEERQALIPVARAYNRIEPKL